MKLLLASVLILASFRLFAGEWELVSTKDDIRIYSKSLPTSQIKSLKAIGVVKASIGKVTSILRNVDAATKWIPRLKERSHVENISDSEAILFEINEMPWPVQDRDLVVHHKLELSEDKKYLVLNFKSVDHTSKPRSSDRVRAQFHHGRLKFIPFGEFTKIELEVLVDPMGSIPKWVVNILQISMPYEFIKSLDEFAGKSSLSTPPGIQKLINQLEP